MHEVLFLAPSSKPTDLGKPYHHRLWFVTDVTPGKEGMHMEALPLFMVTHRLSELFSIAATHSRSSHGSVMTDERP